MVLTDTLVEEIYQTLAKLPFAQVATLIGKMQAEAAQQKQAAAQDPQPPLNGHTERHNAHPNKSKPS